MLGLWTPGPTRVTLELEHDMPRGREAEDGARRRLREIYTAVWGKAHFGKQSFGGLREPLVSS